MIGKEFIESLKEILTQEHCVVVPNFGAFLLRDNGSTLNVYTKELKPTHSNVYFNRDIKNDDGLLANHLKDKLNIGYKDAAAYIQETVNRIYLSVDEKKICHLTPLGNFFKNADGELFFIGNNNLNLNVNSFGLKPIKWNVVTNQEKVKIAPNIDSTADINQSIEEAVIIEVSTQETDYAEIKRHNNKFWNIAANVALITLSVGVLYMNSVFIKSALSNKENAMATNLPVAKVSKTTDEIEQSSVMVINGQIVQLDDQNNAISTQSKKSNIPSVDDYKSIIAAGKGKYFVVGGSYITEDAAKIECKQWNQLNQNATFIKVKGSTLLKVVIKRFESGKSASEFVETLTKLPNNTISVQELTISNK